ncbi:MAG: exopolysaccharide biosynthesis polyprenyl glycosylphosphotransferase [Hyphomicrobiaceae bacterium]
MAHVAYNELFDVASADATINTYQIAKNGLDRVAAFAAFVLLAPVFLLIGAAIKAESRGPVFFRQQRNGLGGCVFKVWKFRTMYTQEDGAQVSQATRNDSRVTGVGRFLRKTSLDELPQLLNVLMGEMSLVGPRPHAVAHNDYYAERIPDYTRRESVKPGISGWAQINGFRGETAELSQMVQRVEHDIWYVRNQSILLDLRIMFLTPFYGLIHKNAY